MGRIEAQKPWGKSIVTVQPFDPAFITQYEDSFTEVVRLGSLAAQKSILGKQSKDEDRRVDRFLKVLKALSIPGLSADDIESLEYDLISQNQTLFVPTAQTLYPQVNNFNKARINTPDVKRRTTQNLGFVAVASMVISPASRQRSQPSISFQSIISGVHSDTLSMNTVARTITKPAITLTAYTAETDVSAELSSAFGGSTFRVSFSGIVRTLTLVQGFDLIPVTESGIIDFQDSVTVTVKKLSNGGLAQDAGTIVWRKNGVDQSSYAFVLGENLGGAGKSYAYTGVVDSDEISVYIAEG